MYAAVFSPDGAGLLTSDVSYNIWLWRVADGTVQEKYVEVSVVPSMAFSRDGTKFGYGRGDAEVVMALNPMLALKPLNSVRITSITRSSGKVVIGWQGGTGPFQLQKRTNLVTGAWQNIGNPTTGNSLTNSSTGTSAFFRIQAAAN